MRLLHLSDTHNQHKSLENLPEADVIIHSGDFSFAGTKAEFDDFLNWFLSLDGKINFGCTDLLEKTLEIKPKFHLFGHIHNAYGTEISKHTTFSNASVLNGNYELQNLPVVFEI